MANPVGGGSNKFQSANNGLQRKFQMGAGPALVNAPVQGGQGNLQVVGNLGDVPYVAIGKGADGVRGGSALRVMGSPSPFGQAPTPGMGDQFAPAPQPEPMPMQHQQQYQEAPAPSPNLGANEEVHTLVARLKGPSGQIYEAPYEVVVPERGSIVLGVVERPNR